MIRALFGKGKPPDPGALVEERWSSSFGRFRQRRFAKEAAAGYTSSVRHGRLELDILKTSSFAWTMAPYKYRDFLLEGRLSIDRDNGHSAVGFVFRYVNDENFYYFLISNRGFFRLDVVFNRNPSHLIEWTPAPLPAAGVQELRVLARGERFSFFLDDEWVADASDATIPEGAIGFGAQNYEDRQQGRFYLHGVSVESRPVEVEKHYYRWVYVVPVPPARRIALARSFLSMGKVTEALGQLRRGVDPSSAGAEELLLLGQTYLQAGLYPEAIENLDRCLSLEPQNPQALVSRADSLSRTRDFLAARDYIRSILQQRPELAGDAYLHGLLGDCEYALGNWDLSESSYRRAIDLDPDSPLYRENLARTLERLDRPGEALQVYLEAARLLFSAQTHDELSLVIARAEAILAPADNAALLELKVLEGKMLYQEGDRKGAEIVFREALDRGVEDSAVDYLYALILIEHNRRREAEHHLDRAARQEDSFALYWFRLAENRYLHRSESARRPNEGPLPDPEEALERALALSPEDPWINNLYGQVLMDGHEPERALEFFERALGAAQESVDIYRNHTDALLHLGRHEAAAELATRGLEACGEHAELLNLRGNALVELKRFDAARDDYERALGLDPDNLDFMENCATCCLELDLILRAEELLNRILEEDPSAWAYNLTGSLAMRKNEHERARLAFEEALKLEPGNREVRLNLVSLCLDQGQYDPARDLLDGVLAEDGRDPRALELRGRLRDRFESTLECAACGRQWWVPREVAPQPGFTVRGEPPGDAPAGRCGSCGRLYCIACAAAHVEGQRLMCPECREPLRIAEESLKYLVLRSVESNGPEKQPPRPGGES